MDRKTKSRFYENGVKIVQNFSFPTESWYGSLFQFLLYSLKALEKYIQRLQLVITFNCQLQMGNSLPRVFTAKMSFYVSLGSKITNSLLA